MTELTVTCRCGETELRIAGEPVAQIYCHCDDCRAAHSAAYVASSIYPAAALQVTQGEPVASAVKRTPRLRCGACGTHLFAEITSVGLRSLNAFLLPPQAFKPQCHIQCQHALLPVVDALPHFKAFPPAFGGSDERVSW